MKRINIILLKEMFPRDALIHVVSDPVKGASKRGRKPKTRAHS